VGTVIAVVKAIVAVASVMLTPVMDSAAGKAIAAVTAGDTQAEDADMQVVTLDARL
jgi:hypothetical protein